MRHIIFNFFLLFLTTSISQAQTETQTEASPTVPTLQERLQARITQSNSNRQEPLLFDIPLTYNKRVSYWLEHYQTKGKYWFADWLERSTKYMPFIQRELKSAGLPQDLAYMVMIESGFDSNAKSHASAVGPWQFIQATGQRYGLKINWWLDERRDLKKSTLAAVRYLRDLYSEFGSWYLVAASYNMGETGLRRQIKKHKTRDFWSLSRLGALPPETMDYVPKILAATLISKSPGIYGLEEYAKLDPLSYELYLASGGLDLNQLADHIGVTHKSLRELNSEIVLGYIPRQVDKHYIRIPKGSLSLVAKFFQKQEKEILSASSQTNYISVQ